MKQWLKKLIRSPGGQGFLSLLTCAYIKLVYRTSRWSYINRQIIDSYINANKPFIYCFWHGRLLMMTICRRRWQNPIQVLLSEHADGQFIAKVAAYFNIDSVKGSTTRGGAKAVLALIKSSKQGVTLAITPDGPKGPAGTVSKGTLTLAKWAQVDIIPISYSSSRGIILKTWDSFFFPLPFSRGVMVIGNPVPYPRDDLELTALSEKLRDELNLITRQADERVGYKTSPPPSLGTE